MFPHDQLKHDITSILNVHEPFLRVGEIVMYTNIDLKLRNDMEQCIAK